MEFNFNLVHLKTINLLSFSNDLDERSKYIETSTQTFLSGHTTIDHETRRPCDFMFNPAL